MLILFGESGSGKSTLEKILSTNYKMKKIISYTTRSPRVGEIDGVDYYFVTKDFFDGLLRNNLLAEFTNHGDNMYGVAKADCLDDTIAVVNSEGLMQLRKAKGIKVVSIYLKLDQETREQRMIDRQDPLDSIIARREIDHIAFYKDKPNPSDLADAVINITEFKYGTPEQLAALAFNLYEIHLPFK